MHDDFTKQLTERFAGLRLTIDKDGSVTDQNISNEKKKEYFKRTDSNSVEREI